jgi:hypothetical protein
MTWMRAAVRLARQAGRGDDEGFSLMETIVATSIFAIFMSCVMAAIIAMLTSTQKSTSLQDGTANLENVFQTLDHQVRYANGIQIPGQVGTSWYVEWQSQATDNAPQLCTQLKFDTAARTIQERTWQPVSPTTTLGGWKLLAINVAIDPTSGHSIPFVMTQASTVAPFLAHQQLQVYLADRPNGSTTARSTLSTTNANFTALNSTTHFISNICQEVARS